MNEHQVHHHHLGPHAHIMNPEMEAVHTETTEVLLSLLSQNKALSGKSTHKLNTLGFWYRRAERGEYSILIREFENGQFRFRKRNM